MGNGQKAQTRRDRNAKEAAKKSGNNSQKKTNEAAKTIVCQKCRNTFLCTVRKKALEEHASNKHDSTFDQCFPGQEVRA
ncbi:MAG: DUF1909-domain-containing protein [Piptocephalis tieghemiana]|nr:MAG: DUF1909-domain-containing protein [Piptocephalis tieghemiana]